MNKTQHGYRGKRAFDLLVLIATSPLTLPLGIAACLAIRATDGPPVLFRQERAGLNNKSFHVLKFRTMSNARDHNGKLLSDRERLTFVGRVLRKTSIDELPQLINVLRGDMSIVGPRPLYTRYIPHYTERERTRHLTLPGITGLAQVSGRNSAGWRDRLELDALYVANPTFRGDVAICSRTALKALRSEGVSIIAGDSGDPLDIERSHPNGGGLHLRRLYIRDLPLRVEWMAEPSIRKHMNLPECVTIASTMEWYASIQEDTNRYEFAVEDNRGQVLAMTGLRAEEPGSPAEFYIFVKPGFHGSGIGKAATQLTVTYARRTRQIPSVTLTVARANTSAISIYRRLGFRDIEVTSDRLWMKTELEVIDV